ncbi:hypothetical protein JW998_14165 [candidate division KSB1 bacterium]|nr:hypothetical protein [candidate division KSB1 bacterium]
MKVFDLHEMKVHAHDERSLNVFYDTPEFKARMIELPCGGTMRACDMTSYVVFIVMEGAVTVLVDQEEAYLKTGQCLITEPATLSMKSEIGVKILGLQVMKEKK